MHKPRTNHARITSLTTSRCFLFLGCAVSGSGGSARCVYIANLNRTPALKSLTHTCCSNPAFRPRLPCQYLSQQTSGGLPHPIVASHTLPSKTSTSRAPQTRVKYLNITKNSPSGVMSTSASVQASSILFRRHQMKSISSSGLRPRLHAHASRPSETPASPESSGQHPA